MPWREQKIMDQREEFVLKVLSEEVPFKQLCQEYGITRKTGYKWKKRFLEEGKPGLFDQSRRPKNLPNTLTEDSVIRIIQLRHHHPTWGAKKIATIIAQSTLANEAPSVSSVYRVLDKANLLKRKRCHKNRHREYA